MSECDGQGCVRPRRGDPYACDGCRACAHLFAPEPSAYDVCPRPRKRAGAEPAAIEPKTTAAPRAA